VQKNVGASRGGQDSAPLTQYQQHWGGKTQNKKKSPQLGSCSCQQTQSSKHTGKRSKKKGGQNRKKGEIYHEDRKEDFGVKGGEKFPTGTPETQKKKYRRGGSAQGVPLIKGEERKVNQRVTEEEKINETEYQTKKLWGNQREKIDFEGGKKRNRRKNLQTVPKIS